ncbi:hydroxymethylglutaryl-CoA reductase, degradative [Facklamia sp. DSM 111018]|uniref:3-hydroxy-3-methylglutaryl coenzyme A reductase n=1 Tax=Facklamia lactis TaxID=2749967 RepID=A0ABS0LNF0_9LACT|nr:hydroxymethylglutaryl-CoA reductase, degradative [Facklamia lactis]MBG9979629.1 hydroxymethylglutaryl-CoA reductase, degradative [Facklamia lactis]MBG9985691.1 hydroxymethylglutaryl-CoA reductase, degradative [Facklamia lactis]
MNFSKFYRRTLEERRQILSDFQAKDFQPPILRDDLANQMIENFVFTYDLPLGLAMNFLINQREYVVPMVVEEPSVVAAASNGAKFLGDIQAEMEQKQLEGQIILTGLRHQQAQLLLDQHQEKWMDIARQASQSMVKRGGGPRGIRLAEFLGATTSYCSYYIAFDPCDAMGANALNTVLEALSPVIEADSQGQVLMAILSNYSPDSLVKVRAEMPISRLDLSNKKAAKIADAITRASEYAHLDPYRAVTHNKGIMNGVDAVLLATGNDWRAVEAGLHAYASREGSYQALSQWTLSEDPQHLIGEMVLPLQVATVGGTLGMHPGAQWSLELLGDPTGKELAEIIGAVGLAQNFSALKALVTDGIQKGHMALQARSLAIQVGARSEEVETLVQLLRQKKTYNRDVAIELLDKIRHS